MTTARRLPWASALVANLASILAGWAAPPEDSLRFFLTDEGVVYDERAPHPERFFGFPIGEWHLRHHELTAYFRALAAAAPDRVHLEETGTTHGRRAKILLTITSAGNRGRLEELRAANVANALGERPASGEAPAMVWLGYGIHGNEPSGPNASPLVAYHLAAGRGGAIDRLLDQLVVLIDPCLNPDGLDRFAEWSNNHRGNIPGTDPADREHVEAWPSGRTNYYWLDLNRDWLPAVMPESHAHLDIFHRWRPAVYCDFHEMSAPETYFFQPGVPSMANPLIPGGNQELTARLARRHAEALDAIGSLYFTKERFDDFYLGKGSTYPDVHGSVGILFEQGSARGHSQETPNGLLTFRSAIRNQVQTSFSSLRGAAEMRGDLLAHQYQSTTSALREAAQAPSKAWLFAAPGDTGRLGKFARWLNRHRVTHHTLARDLEAGGATYRAHDSLLVPAAQPGYRFLVAAFEKRTAFESGAFYDVSAWNMAEAYGLQWTPLDALPPAGALAVGAETAAAPPDTAGASGGVGLAFSWSELHAPRAAHRLLSAGVRVRAAMAPFSSETMHGAQSFGAGTLVAPFGIQSLEPDEIEAIARVISEEDGVAIHRLTSGLSVSGIDLGSPSMRPLKRPVIALAAGDGTNATHAGSVWHFLDRELSLPLSLLGPGSINAANLARFNVVIASDGRFPASEGLKAWVEDGGTLIVKGEAIRGLSDAKWAPIELIKAEFPAGQVAFAGAREDAARRAIAGAIVEATLDLTHPIAFGFATPRVALMRDRGIFLKPLENPFSSPARYSETPLVSGFIADGNLSVLAGSAAVQIHHLGRGCIILMPDDAVFRSHWYGSARLLLNAIFFGPLMKETPAWTAGE